MTAREILKELKALGRENYKALLMRNYGVQEPCFGVSIADQMLAWARVKLEELAALDLYDTGIYDAMYLAGLIADDARMTKKDLQRWAHQARAGALAGATVAWVTAGSPHGWEMALKWIESRKNHVAVAGWSTLTSLVALKDDSDFDLPKLKQLIARVRKTIHQAPDVVRYGMNGFLIATGCYVKPLTEYALQTGEKIGPVTADLGPNHCQTPFAPDYIRKVKHRGTIGKKRKTVKC